MKHLQITALLLLTTLASPARAASTATCQKLTAPQAEQARKLLEHWHPHDCCDDSVARCLQQKPTCRLAVRLADDICRRVAAGQDRAQILRQLEQRARSMMPGKPADIALPLSALTGEADAPVTVVVYACGRCPFCSELVPALQNAVETSALRGKVKLAFKVFPIRNHPHSKEAGLAMLAAQRQGKLWPYLKYSYGHYDDFDLAVLGTWAEASGMDRARFERELEEAALRQELVASKKEGLRNGVDATPTVFIAGQRYTGELEIEVLIDVIDEAYELATGQQYLPQTDRASAGRP